MAKKRDKRRRARLKATRKAERKAERRDERLTARTWRKRARQAVAAERKAARAAAAERKAARDAERKAARAERRRLRKAGRAERRAAKAERKAAKAGRNAVTAERKAAAAERATAGGGDRPGLPAVARSRPTLVGISEIRAFLRMNTTPIFFVSPTPFNLLGIDRWVRNLYFISYYDCFEGSHPRVFVPKDRPYREFQSIEEINNYLLQDREVIEFIHSKGPGGKVAFLMFDEEAENLADGLGLQVIHPSAALRHRIDSKTVTTRLGNEAGVRSVPNVLGRVRSYRKLLERASSAGLGDDLVVQAPYGDSGRTTFFIRSREDWDRYAQKIAAEREVKVMKRVRCRSAAVEATITRHGTIVGPLMTELIGFPELTPYRGGWCGNDMWPGALSDSHRRRARRLVQRLGERLATEGYRGFFEVDVLSDVDTGDLYLGEINPRISGVSSMTNVTAGAYADLPLFCFHLLEFLDVDYVLDVADINHRWARAETVDAWSQMIIKEVDDRVERLTLAPRTGIWRMEPDGGIEFSRWGNDWHSIVDETEAFFLRIIPPGDYRYRGADLGALITRGRMQTDEFQLSDRGRTWIEEVRKLWAGVPLPPTGAAALLHPAVGAPEFKFG